MTRIKFKYAGLVFLLIIGMITMAFYDYTRNVEIVTDNDIAKFVKIRRMSESSYTLILYDDDRNKIFENKLPIEPRLSVVDKKIIKVTVSLGSPLNYSYFYDPESKEISPTYSNILETAYGKVVYFNKNHIVVADIFNEDMIYTQISRDFSDTAVPSSSVEKARLVTENRLDIKYLKGPDFTVMREVITF